MRLPTPLKVSAIVIGIIFLVASVALAGVGLYPSTIQPLSDWLLTARFWLSVVGALLIAVAVVIRPGLPTGRLFLIPVIALGLWLVSMLAEAAVTYAMISLFY